jgi:uncharacterized repeat protein (TIGR02543 family)
MKALRRSVAILLSVLLACMLLPFGAMADAITTASGFTEAVAAGGLVQLGADIALTAGVAVSKDCTIDVNGHNLTIAADPNGGAGIGVTSGKLTLTDSAGTGKIAITSSYWGISYGGDISNGLVLKNVDLEITGASRVGLFSAAMGRPITMDGGRLTIKNCGTTDVGWGAVRWGFSGDGKEYGGPVAFNSGIVDIEDNGYNWINFYVSHDVVFGDGGDAPLTVTLKNAATAGTAYENTLQLTQIYPDHVGLTINKNATVNITLTGTAGQRRGINSDGAPLVIDGGTLNIDSEYSGAGNTYGLRGIAATVINGGKLNITGTTYGVAPRNNPVSLTVPDGSLVNIENTGLRDSAEPSVINGGSVKMDDAYSIVNGRKAATADDKVGGVAAAATTENTPVNAKGEPLTRFDLQGAADTDIVVAADPSNATTHPGYKYSVGADDNGTAYVWAPAVSVTFGQNQPIYTIRGNTIGFVGGTVPAFPDGMTAPAGTVLCWIDADTGEPFDPVSMPVDRDMTLIAGFAKEIPIDIQESLDGGANWSNGPLGAAPGDSVSYKATIDMSSIAAVAASFGTSPGYLRGTYTITLKSNPALIVNKNAGATPNIESYFQGPAVPLFDLIDVPVKTNDSITFHVKVKDVYASAKSITGTELAGLLNGGMYAVSGPNDTAIVQDKILSLGFGRITATFTGYIDYSHTAFSQTPVLMVSVPQNSIIINMIGVQDKPAQLGDPTLGSVGSDAADTVSATLLAQYVVTYNANGGTGSMSDAKSPYLANDKVTVLPNSFSRSGYTFSGWNTAADGSGTTRKVGTTFTMPAADVTLYAQWTKNGSSSGTTTNYTLTFEPNGGSAVAPITAPAGTVIPLNQTTTMSDYTFDGWYLDKALTVRAASVTLNSDMTVYAKWTKNNSGTGLEKSDHFAYIIGYPDGMVHPGAGITRAETTTIFFRLLTDSARAVNWSTTNTFQDVTADKWYNNAVSTMEKAGFVKGYTDGSFGGSRQITRAEFAVMAARANGAAGVYSGAVKFSDISGHWAEGYISEAAEMGLVNGYADGTFKPDEYITRAEAVTLVNRLLGRDKVDTASLISGMITWPDNMNTAAWYYCAVQEATNSHSYTRRDNNFETWTKINAPRDWAALEKTWSNADSGK